MLGRVADRRIECLCSLKVSPQDILPTKPDLSNRKVYLVYTFICPVEGRRLGRLSDRRSECLCA